MRNRIDRFLSCLAEPLFYPEERRRLRNVFFGLTEECFSVESFEDQWRSELCIDGIPMEFCLILDSSGDISLRQVIDTASGPVTASKAALSVERYRRFVVGESEKARQVLGELAEKHLAAADETPRTYVCHSVQCAPGKGWVGRYYFNTGWRPRHDVEKMLSPYLQQKDVEVLRSLSLPAGNYFGTAFDIGDEGVLRVKVYVLLWKDGRETGLGLAKNILCDRAAQMESLLDLVSRGKTPRWKLPQLLVGIGFYPEAEQREYRFGLPLFAWEWNSFRTLSSILESVLERWGYHRPMTDAEKAPVHLGGVWRFLPTHLSPGVSLTGESLGLYFRPVKNLEIRDRLDRSVDLTRENEEMRAPYSADPELYPRVVREMFRMLLGAQG